MSLFPPIIYTICQRYERSITFRAIPDFLIGTLWTKQGHGFDRVKGSMQCNPSVWLSVAIYYLSTPLRGTAAERVSEAYTSSYEYAWEMQKRRYYESEKGVRVEDRGREMAMETSHVARITRLRTAGNVCV